jgi:predicted HNH restriction endonuclease
MLVAGTRGEEANYAATQREEGGSLQVTRCAEFYEKWNRDPNWCEKNQRTVEHIDNYIGILNTFEKRGIAKKLVVPRLSEYVARSLFEKKNKQIKDQLIERLADILRSGKRCTSSDMKRLVSELRLRGDTVQTDIISPSAFCLRCGNSDAHVLVEHHILPKELGGESGPKTIVCNNCHSILHTILKPYVDEVKLMLRGVA